MKISILGYSGSGKSTLARQLATYYHVPSLHLDKLQFTSNWQVSDRDKMRQQIDSFLQQSEWVIDGNYLNFLMDKRMKDSDIVIVLLFSRRDTLRNILKRYTTYKGRVRPDMADGCYEKIDWPFIWWVLHAGRTKAKTTAFLNEAQKGKELIVIRNNSELTQFLKTLDK